MNWKILEESDFPPLSLPSSLSSWALALTMLFSPLTGLRVGEYLYYADLFFVAAVALGIVERAASKQRLVFCWPYLLSALLLTLSYLGNLDQNVTLNDTNFHINLLLTCLLPHAFLFLTIRNPAEMRFLIYCWTFGAVYGAAYTVAFCNGYFPAHDDVFWLINHRARGLTLQPNALALACFLAYPGLLLMFIEFRNWMVRAAVLAMAWVVWDAIGYSGSRTAVYTVFFMAPLAFVLMYRDIPARARQKIVFVPFIAGILGFLLFAYSASTPYSAIWRLQNGEVASDTIRSALKDKAWEDFYDSPVFGAGYQWYRYSHNVYLEMLHSSGVIGFVGSMIALLLPLVLIYRSRTHDSGNFAIRSTTSCMIAAALGVMFFGLAQTNISGLDPTIPFGLLLYFSVHGLTHVAKPSKRATQGRLGPIMAPR